MNRTVDPEKHALAGAFVLLLVAVVGGYLAGERQFESGKFAFSEDPPFDWVLAALVAGPFLVGAAMMVGVALICRALSRPDGP
jgi:hypothetical protein